jgi:hypothetical protein
LTWHCKVHLYIYPAAIDAFQQNTNKSSYDVLAATPLSRRMLSGNNSIKGFHWHSFPHTVLPITLAQRLAAMRRSLLLVSGVKQSELHFSSPNNAVPGSF